MSVNPSFDMNLVIIEFKLIKIAIISRRPCRGTFPGLRINSKYGKLDSDFFFTPKKWIILP